MALTGAISIKPTSFWPSLGRSCDYFRSQTKIFSPMHKLQKQLMQVKRDTCWQITSLVKCLKLRSNSYEYCYAIFMRNQSNFQHCLFLHKWWDDQRTLPKTQKTWNLDFLVYGTSSTNQNRNNSRYITIIGAHDWRHFQIPFHACKLGYKSVCQSMPKWLHYYIGWATEYGVQMIFTILRRDPRNWLGMGSFF